MYLLPKTSTQCKNPLTPESVSCYPTSSLQSSHDQKDLFVSIFLENFLPSPPVTFSSPPYFK